MKLARRNGIGQLERVGRLFRLSPLLQSLPANPQDQPSQEHRRGGSVREAWLNKQIAPDFTNRIVESSRGTRERGAGFRPIPLPRAFWASDTEGARKSLDAELLAAFGTLH